jgi:hypothetical protein
LTNAYDVPLSVTGLRVHLQHIRAPRANTAHPCVDRDFMLGQLRRSREITLAAGATSTLRSLGIPRYGWPRVVLLNRPVNQDGCKDASLTLAYTASAVAN